MRLRVFIISLCTAVVLSGADWKIVSSTDRQLIIDISISVQTSEDLDPIYLLIGLPSASYPSLKVEFNSKTALPKGVEPTESVGVNWTGKQKLRNLNTAVLQVAPGEGNFYYRSIRAIIDFAPPSEQLTSVPEPEQDFLSGRIVNYSVARNWHVPKGLFTSKTAEYPSGTWFRFTIDEDGIYAIPSSALSGLSDQITTADPRSFKLFTGSRQGRDLSDHVSTYDIDLPANLVEVALTVTGEDGRNFDSNDKIYFHGRGASGFDLNNNSVSYHQSIYYDRNYYWLLLPDNPAERGKRVTSGENSISGSLTVAQAVVYQRYETDIVNPYAGGPLWVGSQISNGGTYNITFQANDPVESDYPVFSFTMLGAGGSSISHQLNLYLQSRQNNVFGTLSWTGSNSYSREVTVNNGQSLNDGINSIFIDNVSSNSASKPYFDCLTIEYQRNLTYTGNPYDFYLAGTTSPQKVSITTTAAAIVWNINDPSTPERITTAVSGSGFTVDLDLAADSTGHYVVFTYDDVELVNTIELIGNTSFTTLRHSGTGVDHLVIAPEDYRSALEPLVDHRGSSLFVPLEQVYQEFTGGNHDPLAIRHFVQWTQENWTGTRPTCVFLVGDADYDYRNITGSSKIVIPTIQLLGGYESQYCTDDRLVTIYGSIPELAIGRYPARTVTDVENFVNKILQYEQEPAFGIWRQRVTLVADDAARPEPNHGSISTGKSHTQNSEALVPLIAHGVTVQKLYMLEYPEESDASAYGVVKPAATQALFDALNRGTALISYIGHGSAHLWAQEKLLDQSRGDINSINTGNRLPVWIAATCSWGHFDAIDDEAFSEDIIRAKANGAAAIISTSRAISVPGNATYITAIFKQIFPNKTVTKKPIGYIVQAVKTGGREGELFHIFGDPGMPLPLPRETVSITAIDPDTLRTLEPATLTGHQAITSAGGTGYVILQDADRAVAREYVISSQTESLSYTLPGGTLFRGQFSVNAADFSAQIRVPEDITYSNNPGEMMVYFQSDDDQPLEALGYREQVYFTGGSNTSDMTGPIITFETTTGRQLQSGDHLAETDGLVIRISDPIGINMAGEVGHGIIVTDNNTDDKYDVTEDYLYDMNSITTGTVEITRYITASQVDLFVSAWDNANNPSSQQINLSVSGSDKLKLHQVLNFPNPFASCTQFAFEITTDAEVAISIYTLGGRRIKRLDWEYFPVGYNYIDWDGHDEYGGNLANGVYLYRIEARDRDSKVTVIGKLAKYQ